MRPATHALLSCACTLAACGGARVAGREAPGHDWPALAIETRNAALAADEHDDPAVLADVRAYRWARLFSKSEGDAYRDWIAALRGTGVGSQLARGDYRVGGRALGEIPPPAAVQAWIADPRCGDLLFSTLAPTDNLVRVLEIVGGIAERFPEDAQRHFNLALAIAVVFDTAPRADWPHAQVSEAQLPRRWPDPVEAFAFWRDEARGGRLFFPLDRMSVAELTHVVDASSSFDDLRWAQSFLPVAARPGEVDALLERVPLRAERLEAGDFHWNLGDYRLQTLLATGGLCVDRAYFVTQVLKSRGVPAVLLAGAGQRGRHAWVGFQAATGSRWRLDCGREDRAKVFDGVVLDPQSWREIDEWEVRRWGGPLRSDERSRAAALQAELAALWRDERKAELALRAAYRAVALDPLEVRWWDGLLATCDAVRGPRSEERVAILRGAIAVSWPDPGIEARFVAGVAAELEARGDPAGAADEWARFMARLELRGVESQLDGARERVLAEIQRGRLDVARPIARRVIADRGRDAGVALLDRFVYPLVRQLRATGQAAEADWMLAETRQRVAPRVPGVAQDLARAGY